MGKGEKSILATFATNLSVPNRFRSEGGDELNLLGLNRQGSRLQNGCFGFDTKHPSDLVLEMKVTGLQLSHLLGGDWQPCGPFKGDPLAPLSPIEVMEIISGSPLGRIELKEIRKDGRRLDDETFEQKNAFAEWFRCYLSASSGSPLGRPALEARVRAASAGNKTTPNSITPEQLRALMGARVFEQMKNRRVGLITF